MKTQVFKVKGKGFFPIDMLRYDCCYPNNSEDVGRVRGFDDGIAGERIVELGRRVEKKTDLPTNDRWKSFGWQVIEVRTF